MRNQRSRKLKRVLMGALFLVLAVGLVGQGFAQGITVSQGGPAAAGGSALPRTTEVEYWAVIVGIADYLNFSNLFYTDDDAQDVYDGLLAYDNWSAGNIMLLKDGAANRTAIQSAIATVGGQVKTLRRKHTELSARAQKLDHDGDGVGLQCAVHQRMEIGGDQRLHFL